MKLRLGLALSFVLFTTSLNTFATAYRLPPANEAVVGSREYTHVGMSDTVASIAQKYDVGYNALVNSNPQLNLEKPLPYGASMQIPTEHLLPSQTREGIVVNLPEMRMYYYPKNTNEVYTYPIGIGKIGKTIPIEYTSITKKVKDPSWIPPEDIREFNLAQGVILPQVMPAGPDNPLGPYAIYMRIPTFLIHSTIFPESIGKRASFGCLRMYEKDIFHFFPSIEPGIPVAIVNYPVKLGWQHNQLVMEAYMPLEEHSGNFDANLPGMVHSIHTATKDQPTIVDWQAVSYLAKERDGLPHPIAIRIANR